MQRSSRRDRLTKGEEDGRIRISEIFISVQGEGPKVGTPTTFLRTAGCNFRCEGWGVKTVLPNGETVVGCDSPHSVFPELYKQPGGSIMVTARQLINTLPFYPKNICLTGGEPLLQARNLDIVISEILASQGHTIEVFTNGSVLAPWRDFGLTYIMDYKLESSGEGGKFNDSNFRVLSPRDRIKFVIGTPQDYQEAVEVYTEKYTNKLTRARFMFGVVWGTLDPKELISWIIRDELQVDLNLQTQSMLGMDESERTAYHKVV
jgi:7-carboxy-7-deazaguanine synthase